MLVKLSVVTHLSLAVGCNVADFPFVKERQLNFELRLAETRHSSPYTGLLIHRGSHM